VIPRTGPRESSLHFASFLEKQERTDLNWFGRGYVALAVATESGTYKRELSTGLGGDREANMIQFAVEGLVLLRDVIRGDAKL